MSLYPQHADCQTCSSKLHAYSPPSWQLKTVLSNCLRVLEKASACLHFLASLRLLVTRIRGPTVIACHKWTMPNNLVCRRHTCSFGSAGAVGGTRSCARLGCARGVHTTACWTARRRTCPYPTMGRCSCIGAGLYAADATRAAYIGKDAAGFLYMCKYTTLYKAKPPKTKVH